MTDKELITELKNYTKSYTDGKPYSFNPGLALIIANRIEELIIIDTQFNIGDRVWVPSCIYDEWFVENKDGCVVDSIRIYIGSEGKELKMYTLKNNNSFQEYPPRLCFGSYKECQDWCDKNNKL